MLVRKTYAYAQKISQVVIAGVIGYFFGSIFGILTGTIFGSVLALFFREIVYSYQTILMSILFAIVLGGFLGFLSVATIRKVYGTDDAPVQGMLSGAVLGLIVILGYGVIVISNPKIFSETFYVIPMIYGAGIGQYIGSINCMLIGVILTIREFVLNRVTPEKKQEFDAVSAFYKKQLKK